jgi:hypothetical protein
MASRKAAGKKAPAKKKAAKKPAKPAKKAGKKKAPAKKAAGKKAAKKKAAPKKKPAAKKAAKSKAKRARPVERQNEALENAGATDGIARRRKRPTTTLPPDHEVLVKVEELRGQPVDKQIAIEAIRAAFEADAEHPVRGRERIGPPNRILPSKPGDLDYAIAQEHQAAAREIIDAGLAARERDNQVDERIAKIYSEGTAQQASDSGLDPENKPDGA